MTDKTRAVVTVIADVEDEWIWAEAELEGKDILKWISELRESCIIKLIHISTRTGSDKTWRIE